MNMKRGDKKVKLRISSKRFFEQKNRKGLSGIVTALILIVLVLVAAGIVWAVYNSLIKGSAEDVKYNEKCLGVSLDVTSLSCITADPYTCTVKVERSIGSNEEFDGADIEFNDGTKKFTTTSTENIAVKGAFSKDTEVGFQATEVQIRVYFDKEDGEKYYCSPATVYEKP